MSLVDGHRNNDHRSDSSHVKCQRYLFLPARCGLRHPILFHFPVPSPIRLENGEPVEGHVLLKSPDMALASRFAVENLNSLALR